MRFGRDQLRDKALLALEEAVVECRYCAPRRSIALRFALAYLWTSSRAAREPFDALWGALGRDESPWSSGVADSALLAVYRAWASSVTRRCRWRYGSGGSGKSADSRRRQDQCATAIGR